MVLLFYKNASIEPSGADSDAYARHGYNSLHLAAQGGYADTASVLMKEGRLSVNDQTEEGYSPLLLACYGGHIEVTEDLLAAGAGRCSSCCS